MTNNYSHDIATAFLAVSGATLLILSSGYPAFSSAEGGRYFVRIYRGVVRMAMYSLAWILVAGVPRVIFYGQFEWTERGRDLQVVAIVIKHIVMFLLVGIGVVSWSRLNERVKVLRRNHKLQ